MGYDRNRIPEKMKLLFSTVDVVHNILYSMPLYHMSQVIHKVLVDLDSCLLVISHTKDLRLIYKQAMPLPMVLQQLQFIHKKSS